MQAELSKRLNDFTPGPVQKINIDWGHDHLYIKRLDLLQSWASGNKYYKLKHHLADCIEHNVDCIVSKGGMFSNHLHALAQACFEFGIKCICVIRSYGDDASNPSLQFLRDKNCQLFFKDPAGYQQYDEKASAADFPDCLFIPEGGADEHGIRGSKEIMIECLEENPDYIIVAGGTMSTALGMVAAAPEDVKVVMVPAWKGCTEGYVADLLQKRTILSKSAWTVWGDYHFGGFGRYNKSLAEFMYGFTDATGIPLDPVYTGKMMFAIRDQIESGYFKPGEKILAMHTGGLQGISGCVYRDVGMWGRYSQLLRLRDNASEQK